MSHVQFFCDCMDCSLPGCSVHGIFQARILEGLPFPSPGHHPNPGIEPMSPALEVKSLPLSHQGSPIIYWVTVVVGWHHRLNGHEFE